MQTYLITFIFLALFSLGCDSDTFNPVEAECEGENCETSKGETTAISTTESSTTVNVGSRTPSSVSNPISIGSSSSTTTTSSSGGVGGFANSGSGQGSSSGGSTDPNSTTIEYNTPGGYANYFAKLNEPIDKQVSEKLPFAFKFVAVGRMPLKYTWYKETEGGKTKLGSTFTVFSKDSASLSDSGTYFATVEDSEGNILTSRKATLKVNPERKPCYSGTYGPKVYENNSYNYSTLVSRTQMSRTSGARFVDLPKEIDGYAVSYKGCIKYRGSGTCTSGSKTMLQCQNGAYVVSYSNCRRWDCGE